MFFNSRVHKQILVYSYNSILYEVMDKKKESSHKRGYTLLFTVYKFPNKKEN